MAHVDPIEAAFGKIYGLPCWNVRPGHGSFLTLEFGQPHLTIREPCEAIHTESAKIKRIYARRKVVLHGDWYLWIYCCDWTFSLAGELVGDGESEQGIQDTVCEMDGQKLVRVMVNHPPGHSVFEFDLGGPAHVGMGFHGMNTGYHTVVRSPGFRHQT